jgi:two-component system NtrC family sensor kinase
MSPKRKGVPEKSGLGTSSTSAESHQKVRERILIDDELRRSEERFRTLIENSSDAVTVLNADGTLRYESPSMSRMLGYEPGATMGKASFELVHPDDLPGVADGLSKLLQSPGGTAQLDVRVQHKDGSWRILEVVARNLLDEPAIEGIVVNQRDITERKQAEEQLRQSEERYRLLAENVTDVIWTMDMDLKYTYVSPSVERLRGYSVEEVMTQGIQASVAPESLEVALNVFAEELAIEELETKDLVRIRTLELELNCKDGSTIWTEIRISSLRDQDGRPVGILGITREITKRRQMERELRESEDRLRTLIENAPDSIGAYELDGTIVDVNRKGEELLGYSRDELVGRNMLDIGVIPEDYISRTVKAFANNVWDSSGRPFEFELIRKDGSRICVEVTTLAVERQGKTEVICISRDVTQRKQMEQQLHLAGRLAAVGQLAAGVAHELNNPLSAVQGFAQLLAQRSNLDEATKGDIETIYREAQRATKITGNLLSFARKYTPEKRLISVNEALEQSLELHAYRMRVNNVEVVTQLDPDLPKTMADFHQMQQVFVNITTNAEQAVTEVRGKGRVVVKTKRVGNMIRVTFTDDGPGIPDDILKSVFDPFFTTKDVGKGTGLGLSICYGIVREHGGRMYAKSDTGKGASFVVEIPIVSKDQNVAEAAGASHTFHSAPQQP